LPSEIKTKNGIGNRKKHTIAEVLLLIYYSNAYCCSLKDGRKNITYNETDQICFLLSIRQ